MQLASRPTTAALYPRPLSESAAVTLTRERPGAAEEFCHLRAALASGATLAAPGRRRVLAGTVRDRVRRPLGRAAADALSSLASELWPTDPERSLELRSELQATLFSAPVRWASPAAPSCPMRWGRKNQGAPAP